MSDAISSIGSAAVTTVGTLAVTGAAMNIVSKQASRMNGSGGMRRRSSPKRRSSGRRSAPRRSSKSFSVWH